MQRIDELGDLLLGDHLLEDVPLPDDAGAGLLDQLGLAALGLLVGGGGGQFGLHLGAYLGIVLGELRGDAVRFGFHLELVGGHLDGHAGAVEGEGKQNVLAAVALELGPEDGLGQTEGVADVQNAIHVRVGEGDDELVVGISDARLAGFGVGSKAFWASHMAWTSASLARRASRLAVPLPPPPPETARLAISLVGADILLNVIRDVLFWREIKSNRKMPMRGIQSKDISAFDLSPLCVPDWYYCRCDAIRCADGGK